MPFIGGTYSLPFRFGTGTAPNNQFPPEVGADFDDLALALAGLPINIKAPPYNATGNGSTNDSLAIQAAIDAASAVSNGQGIGGVVLVPPGTYLCNVTLKDGVQLISTSFSQYGDTSFGHSITCLKAFGAGPVVDTPVTQCDNMAIVGIDFVGLGAGTACQGIRLRNCFRVNVDQCNFNNFSDEAIKIDGGGSITIQNCFADNCLLNRTRSGLSGVLDINGADHFLYSNEVTPSLLAKTAGGQCCGIVFRAANSFVTSCIAELSDLGIYVSGQQNRFVGVRSDSNQTDGWLIDGVKNQFIGCYSYNNGLNTANTYAGFNSNLAQYCLFVGCSVDNPSITLKYAYNDQNGGASSQANRYIACPGRDYATALVNNQFNPCYYQPAAFTQFIAATATVDVTEVGLIQFSNVSPVNISLFSNGIVGQTIRLMGNTNITLIFSANLVTNTGGNKTLAANKIYTFTCIGTGGAFWENA